MLEQWQLLGHGERHPIQEYGFSITTLVYTFVWTTTGTVLRNAYRLPQAVFFVFVAAQDQSHDFATQTLLHFFFFIITFYLNLFEFIFIFFFFFYALKIYTVIGIKYMIMLAYD